MIEKITAQNPIAQSAQMIPENMARLAEMFPDAFADGKVNVQKLLENIGVFAENEEEKFGLNWSGKQKAKQIALAPTNKTLRPNKDESKNWDTTENLYIEGDNLEVLKLLQKAYAGQIKMIYIDPPYNTGKDFVYSDKFAMANKDALVREGLVDDEGSKIKSTDVYDVNTKNSARYHTNWLNMMYPRLRLARNLLHKKGMIFISIDDAEVADLRFICDEIFGEENLIAQICHKARASVSNDKIISSNHNHILFYAKSQNDVFEIRKLIGLKPELDGFENPDNDERGPWKPTPVDGPGGAKKGNPYYSFLGIEGFYRYSKETMQEKYDAGLIIKNANSLQKKYFLTQAEKSRKTDTTWWDDAGLTSTATRNLETLMGGKTFDTPKPVELIYRMLTLTSFFDKESFILDFFSGSATTAHAVMQLNAEDQGNRKFILVQIPEACAEDSEAAKAGYANICEIGKERIRRAGEKVISENADKDGIENLDIGFRVFKLDTSNIKEWNTETDDLLRDLFNHQDHLNEKRSDEDILFELMLKLNRPLTAPIETKKIAKQTVFCVDDGALIICLPKAKALTNDNVEALSEGIIQWHKETGYISGPNNQTHFVFRDTAFSDDVAKANLSAIFEQAGYNNLRSL